jgi:hypothetical protein
MEPEKEEQLHLAHTYQDDMAQAMNATEAPIVQEMLADARERDALAAEEVEEHKERKWYSITSLLLIGLTLVVIGGGTYYYTHLTVPVQPVMSVGIFPSTANIVASTTTIDRVIATFSAPTTLPEGKPTLVNLVTDAQTNTLLSDTQLFSFMGASVPEPLQSAISVARLGLLNTGSTVVPFIIASVPDPEKASQELSNAEPTLLQLFSKPLSIDLTQYQSDEGQPFQSQYFYNLPVRTLSTGVSVTAPQSIILLYGYVNNNTVVITTQPVVLQAVYNAIINQP